MNDPTILEAHHAGIAQAAYLIPSVRVMTPTDRVTFVARLAVNDAEDLAMVDLPRASVAALVKALTELLDTPVEEPSGQLAFPI